MRSNIRTFFYMADIGGGATANDAPYALSNVSLRWMIKEVIESKVGILFSFDALHELGMPVLMRDGILGLEARPASKDQAVIEREHLWEKDMHDVRHGVVQYAFAGMMMFFWALMECLPFMKHYRDSKGTHIPILCVELYLVISHACTDVSLLRPSPNLFQPRKLSHSAKKVVPRIHISVRERMEHTKDLGYFGRYEPRARWKGYPASDPEHVLWEV